MREASSDKIFICFSDKDRYSIVQPIVHHLKNYGLNIWYDKTSLLLGDDRKRKNLIEGAQNCKYAIVIISKNTATSKCAMEEISILKLKNSYKTYTLFPVLYEIKPDELVDELQWVEQFIFKEITKNSGTRELCNHIACKITLDYLKESRYKKIKDVISDKTLPLILIELLKTYDSIDSSNLNGRVSILYSSFLVINNLNSLTNCPKFYMISKIYQRIFTETKLNLSVENRELWLLENAICLLINYYYTS